MNKKTVYVLLVLLCVSMAASFYVIPEAHASTTLTFTTSTSDGEIYYGNTDYLTARDSTTGTVSSTGSTFTVGQYYIVGTAKYYITRGLLFFDTSSIPDSATIDSAVLSLLVNTDHSENDFSVTIQNGQPTYPHDPFIAGDYYYQNYAGDGGSRSTGDGLSESAYWNITLNGDGEGWISLTGTTKLCLRSSDDISGSSTTDYDFVIFDTAEAGASYKPKLYVTYTVPPSYSTLTLTSSPAISAEISINGTDYTTPSYEIWQDEDTAHLTAESGVIYSGTGYIFDHWLINGTTTYTTQTINLVITGDSTIAAYYVEIANVYYFYGAYDEETGYLLDENVTVSIFYDSSGYPYYSHSFNGSWSYPVSPQALFFRFTFEDNSTREYWVDSSEDVLPVYIFHGNVSGTQATYTVQFTDTTGVLNSYPFVTVQRYINGTLHTVEKRKVDIENKILTNVIPYRTYTLSIGESTAYTFGDLTFGASSSITLTIKSLMFPENVVMGYRYVRCYAYRDMSSGTVYVFYQDLREDTDSITIQVYYLETDGLVLSSVLEDTDEWSYSLSSLDENRSYYVTVTVEHGEFGTLTYKQVLPALNSNTAPFGLEALGGDELPFNLAYIIPIIAILAVAASFSALNTVVGLFATVVTAIIVAWIGWLPISAEVLVFVFALVIIYGISTLRRKTYS